MREIQEGSVKSLLIRMRFNGQELAIGTAFVVRKSKGYLLITARHNVTGRSQVDGKCLHKNAGIPNEIEIIHNTTNKLGRWHGVVEPILDSNGSPLWVEHPKHGRKADFVALPLNKLDGVAFHPYDLDEGLDIEIRPAETLSVVGFPFGLQADGYFAIWMTGFMASEPQIDYGDLPTFLIDCQTRSGNSGSPVIAIRNGVVQKKTGVSMGGGQSIKFLGIYSGRINAEADIGIVWKATAIKELVDSIF